MPEYFLSLEHLLRSCARPAFAVQRLSVVSGTGHRPERIRYTLPRHKRWNRVGPRRCPSVLRGGREVSVKEGDNRCFDVVSRVVEAERMRRIGHDDQFTFHARLLQGPCECFAL